jgi:hypothetical protein
MKAVRDIPSSIQLFSKAAGRSVGLKIDEQSADALTFRIAEGLSQISPLFGLSRYDFHWAQAIGKSLPESLITRVAKICGEGGLLDFLFG